MYACMYPQRRIIRVSHMTPLGFKVKKKARRIISVMSFLVYNHRFIMTVTVAVVQSTTGQFN